MNLKIFSLITVILTVSCSSYFQTPAYTVKKTAAFGCNAEVSPYYFYRGPSSPTHHFKHMLTKEYSLTEPNEKEMKEDACNIGADFVMKKESFVYFYKKIPLNNFSRNFKNNHPRY